MVENLPTVSRISRSRIVHEKWNGTRNSVRECFPEIHRARSLRVSFRSSTYSSSPHRYIRSSVIQLATIAFGEGARRNGEDLTSGFRVLRRIEKVSRGRNSEREEIPSPHPIGFLIPSNFCGECIQQFPFREPARRRLLRTLFCRPMTFVAYI